MLSFFSPALMVICLFLTSCAGYRLQEKSNPFERYGIRHIQIPMFYNHSALPNVSAPFTREIKNMLYKYQGLKIYSGADHNVDAVLIGIISSPKNLADTIENKSLRIAGAGGATGSEGRRDFYIPGSSKVTLNLRLMLVKNPSQKEIEVLQSEFGKYVKVDSKVIFNESFNVTDTFIREIFDGQAGQIHYTQNQGAVQTTVDAMAVKASESFRSLILYAF